MKNIKRFYAFLLVLLGFSVIGMIHKNNKDQRIKAYIDKRLDESCKREPVNCPPTQELREAAYEALYHEARLDVESGHE